MVAAHVHALPAASVCHGVAYYGRHPLVHGWPELRLKADSRRKALVAFGQPVPVVAHDLCDGTIVSVASAGATADACV